MIGNLRLRNFQRWKRLNLPLSTPVTVIAGPTDSGKSSALRALRWLLLNRPNGQAFVHNGAKGCRVSADLDGTTLSRRRNGSTNTYELQGEEYRSFGSGVPEPVSTIANVDDVNFAGQHDPPFWFGLTPGQVSQELNRIVDLELIDRSLAAAAAEVRDARQELLSAESNRESAETRLRGLSWVDGADYALKEIASAKADSARFRGNGEALQAVLSEIAETRRNLGGIEKVEKGAGKYLEALDRTEEVRGKMVNLRSLLDRIQWTREALAEAEEREKESPRCPTCGKLL